MIALTPAVLRALGEGVSRLNDGDENDGKLADEVVEAMRALGYRKDGGYEFVKTGRFSLFVSCDERGSSGEYGNCDTEERLREMMRTAWLSPDRADGTYFEVWDYDESRYREDLIWPEEARP